MKKKWQYRYKMFQQYKGLIWELVTRDVKLKYRRSFLGYLWSILNPLSIMVVMTIVFSAMFKRDIENYPVYLLVGRMTFEFMKVSTSKSLRSVTGNAALLKKAYIPKYIFTVSCVISCMTDYVFTFGALIIVMLVTRSPFYLTMLLAPVILIQLFLFCLGLCFMLGALNVFFRDITYIWQAIVTAWTYLTPIFYPIEQLPSSLQLAVKLFNPMYYYVAEMRDIILYGRIPGPRVFWGGWILGFLMLFIGIYIFEKRKDRFILYI